MKLRERFVWELTQQEFVKMADPNYKSKSRYKLFADVQRIINIRKSDIIKDVNNYISKSNSLPNNIFILMDPTNIAKSAHKLIVQMAVESGAKVPWRSMQPYYNSNIGDNINIQNRIDSLQRGAKTLQRSVRVNNEIA